jgi:hypothetical protein
VVLALPPFSFMNAMRRGIDCPPVMAMRSSEASAGGQLWIQLERDGPS